VGPVTLLFTGSGHFRAKPFFPYELPLHFLNIVILHLSAYEDGTDSVLKRRHIKLRRQGITQKKANNIQNTVKVLYCLFVHMLVYNKHWSS